MAQTFNTPKWASSKLTAVFTDEQDKDATLGAASKAPTYAILRFRTARRFSDAATHSIYSRLLCQELSIPACKATTLVSNSRSHRHAIRWERRFFVHDVESKRARFASTISGSKRKVIPLLKLRSLPGTERLATNSACSRTSEVFLHFFLATTYTRKRQRSESPNIFFYSPT